MAGGGGHTKMSEDRVGKMQRRLAEVMMEEFQGWIDDTLKGILDPGKIMAFIQSMGIDLTRLQSAMQGAPGFDPYQVLGLDKSATDEEIKKRYRELVFKLHPDQSGTPGTTFLFRMVMAAYEMIKEQRRWQ